MDATLQDDLPLDAMFEAEAQWAEPRVRMEQEFLRHQAPLDELLESLHWRWSRKGLLLMARRTVPGPLSTIRVMGIEARGKWQGMMLAHCEGYRARIGAPGRNLVYGEYVESAPWNWNVKAIGQQGLFKGVGMQLMGMAVLWSEQLEMLVALLLCVPTGVYAVAVRNDLGRRLERLKSLAANVRAARQRRQGVGKDVGRHVGHAQRHEQRVTQFGSSRGQGGGRLVKVSDTSNGWPIAGTTAITTQGLTLDTQSRDSETAARVALHAEAEAYNSIVRSWPSSVVAHHCGFRPWQYEKRGHTRFNGR